jgi:hypothetical protein
MTGKAQTSKNGKYGQGVTAFPPDLIPLPALLDDLSGSLE